MLTNPQKLRICEALSVSTFPMSTFKLYLALKWGGLLKRGDGKGYVCPEDIRTFLKKKEEEGYVISTKRQGRFLWEKTATLSSYITMLRVACKSAYCPPTFIAMSEPS